MRSRLIILFCILFVLNNKAGNNEKKLIKGFEALSQYDYFKARQSFYSCNKFKTNYAASYGLAFLFFKNNNPFTNTDSARKYIQLSYQSFLERKKTFVHNQWRIDSLCILQLADSITQKLYKKAKSLNSVRAYNEFLYQNSLADSTTRKTVLQLRDELIFIQISQVNKSDTTRDFMLKYPMSLFLESAKLLLDRQMYAELTAHQKPEEYIAFLKKYPNSVMVEEAYDKLFEYYRKKQSIKGLSFFVENYPKAAQLLEAWKLLFSLSVKAFTPEELKKFLDEYPKFPLKNSILKEVELSQLNLYPFQKDDFIGFINDKAQIVIEPQFDQASPFYEGLSVVSRNDSVYFINKENKNPFNQYYADAYPFRNGLAAVKTQQHWFFINRQGQVASRTYDEINDLSNLVYVFKSKGKYGALNQYAHLLMESKFDKLGDFKNEVAYFMIDSKYGFITIKGKMYKEEFDWISDFDEQQLAIYKLNNKYGLITVTGKKLLTKEYDQIIKLNNRFYMLIENNLYGFYSYEGCYISPVIYEYNKEKPIDFYCRNASFKLLKKTEQGIMDENGKLEVNFGLYKEIDFLGDGLMCAKRKSKYGFIDKKLNVVIPFKYEVAQGFSDSLALVKHKNSFQLINTLGKEILVSDKAINHYLHHYYLIDGDTKTLINKRGEIILTDIITIQELDNKQLLVTFSNGEMRLMKD